MPARLASGVFVRSITRRVAEGCGVLLMAAALGGCDAAVSNESGNSSMLFGLFKNKYRTAVRPELRGVLKRETAFPAVQQPPAPAYPVVRNVSADAPPPGGTLDTERRGRPPADVFIVDGAAGRPLRWSTPMATSAARVSGRSTASDSARPARLPSIPRSRSG